MNACSYQQSMKIKTAKTSFVCTEDRGIEKKLITISNKYLRAGRNFISLYNFTFVKSCNRICFFCTSIPINFLYINSYKNGLICIIFHGSSPGCWVMTNSNLKDELSFFNHLSNSIVTPGLRRCFKLFRRYSTFVQIIFIFFGKIFKI